MAGDLPPLVSLPATDLATKQRLHLNGLGQTGGAGPRGGAEHGKDNVGLEHMKPSVGQGTDTLQRHRLSQGLKQRTGDHRDGHQLCSNKEGEGQAVLSTNTKTSSG